jgi:hypothetical protein
MAKRWLVKLEAALDEINQQPRSALTIKTMRASGVVLPKFHGQEQQYQRKYAIIDARNDHSHVNICFNIDIGRNENLDDNGSHSGAIRTSDHDRMSRR